MTKLFTILFTLSTIAFADAEDNRFNRFLRLKRQVVQFLPKKDLEDVIMKHYYEMYIGRDDLVKEALPDLIDTVNTINSLKKN